MQFNDRFLIANPGLAALNLDTATDAQLETVSPLLKEMAGMVRVYSVLLSKRTSKEIYNILTLQVDPRIALILAASKDKKGVPIFPNMTVVKETMFGPSDPGATAYVAPAYNIFNDGIKRIAVALTASILIGQLAQIKEQADHAIHIEDQAIKDLDRLLQVPDLTVTQAATTTVVTESFYFEDKSFDLGNSILQMELYIPSTASTGWQVVNTYAGQFSTATIAADLADAINTATLITGTSNVLAAPIFAQASGYYAIDFQARRREAYISAEVVTARITDLDNPTNDLPFLWGVSTNDLRPKTLNSVFLTVQQGKVTTAGTTVNPSTLVHEQPTVLYFRRAPLNTSNDVLDYKGSTIARSQWAIDQTLTFRISPMMEANLDVKVPYLTVTTGAADQLTSDKNRPSQVARLLLDNMFQIKDDTRSLGALIRNDDPSTPNAMAALELVAFSASDPEAWMILDVLQIPIDVQMAVGNLIGPTTPFSNKPRSIRVESKVRSSLRLAAGLTSDNPLRAAPSLTKIPTSDFMRSIQERGRRNLNPYDPFNSPTNPNNPRGAGVYDPYSGGRY